LGFIVDKSKMPEAARNVEQAKEKRYHVHSISAIISGLVPLWSSVFMGVASICIILANFKPFRSKLPIVLIPLIAIYICAFSKKLMRT
jgi:hypothetical protein